MRKRFLARLLLILVCWAPSLATAQKKALSKPAVGPLDDFDVYVQRVMQEWKVPGAAIAVVKEGKIVLSKSYGMRDVKDSLPVTDQTLFPIASISITPTSASERSTQAVFIRQAAIRSGLRRWRRVNSSNCGEKCPAC